jgi:hypothetical protein
MILNRITVPIFALLLATAGPALARPQAYGQPGWDVPPREYNQIQQRGFHDGIEGARKDYGNGRRPDVNNRDEYRHPDLPPELREPYRQSFRRGYEVAASHLWVAPPSGNPAPPPPPPPPPPPSGWDNWAMRGLSSDAQRRGYHEGAQAAQNDFAYHHPPDPDDHPEYRNPPVPPPVAEDYREGFMRGYTAAISRLSGDTSWQYNGDPNRWMPPSAFSDIQRRGFHDGIDGAQKDFGNHRRPNPANRDEYRSPHLPPQLWPGYREGFRRGYEMMAARLWGGM